MESQHPEIEDAEHEDEESPILDRSVEIIPGCIVCKTCEFTCPDVFEVEEMALEAKVRMVHPPKRLLTQIHEAIKNCPEKIIKFKRVKK